MAEKFVALTLFKALDFNALKFFRTFVIGGARLSSDFNNHFDFMSRLNYLFKKFEELYFPLLMIQAWTSREANKIIIA
jgi:hypothetical protein